MRADPRLPARYCAEHGRYVKACAACVEARRAHDRRRDRLAGYGTPPLVDVLPSRRRLSALMALGWPIGWLGVELGMTENGLRDLFAGAQMRTTRATDARIRAAYDRLWNTVPVGRTPGERMAISRTRNRARVLGYEPPLAWDEDELDAPLALTIDEGNTA